MLAADLLGVFSAASPGLFGLFAAATLAGIYCREDLGMAAVISGAGGILGYLALALFIRWRDAQGAQVFTPALLPAFWLLSVIFAGCTIWVWSQPRSNGAWSPLNSVPGWASKLALFIGLGLMALLVSQTIIRVATSPVSSWDALNFWARWGESFLRFDLDPDGFRGKTRAEHGVFPMSHSRHPPTLYHLSAFSGFALAKADLMRGWLVPWSFTWLCGALVVWGFVREVSNQRWLSLVAAYFYCSLPLLENHAVLVGYADLWVTVIVTIAAALLALAIHRSNLPIGALGLLLALTPLLLKNTGILYSTALIFSLVVMFSVRRAPKLFVTLLAAAFVFVCWLYINGFDVSAGGQRIALIWGEKSQIIFGGYTMSFERYPALHILRNELWAFFVNQTFSVTGLLWVCALVLVISGHKLAFNDRRALSYLLTVCAFLLLAFMLPQMTEQYAERFAAPKSDLGNSRFLMAVGAIVLMTLGFFGKVMDAVRIGPPQHPG